MEFATADLYDDFGDELESCSAQFRSYGARPRFWGRIATVRCFQDNALVKQILSTAGDARVLVVDGGGSRSGEAMTGRRPVYFRGAGFVDTPSYAREGLTAGMVLEGPAIIEQSDATPLVAPGFRARVDAAHNILLERSHG